MVAGVQTVKSGEMSQRAALTIFNVSRAILQTRINQKVTLHAKPGRWSRFTYQQEKKPVDYACNRADMDVGFGKKRFLIYAGSMRKGVKFKDGKPSNKWWYGMLKRHPYLKLRKSEPTVAVHHQGMDRELVILRTNSSDLH